MPADAVGGLVGPHDLAAAFQRMIAADPALDVLVAGEPGLLLGGDRVHVRRGDARRGADGQLPGSADEAGHQVLGAGPAALVDHRPEGVEPLLGLLRVDVGELVGEPVDDHVVPLPHSSMVLFCTCSARSRLPSWAAIPTLPPPERRSDGTTTVFTDGACSGNPGPGGWAWVEVDGAWACGFEPDTTNQRMEVTAALRSVRALRRIRCGSSRTRPTS